MLVYRKTIDSVLLFLLQNLFYCSWESNLKKIKNKYRTRIFFKYLSCVFTIMIRPSCHHKNHNDLKPLSWFIRASERKWVASVLLITFASRCAVINLIIPPPVLQKGIIKGCKGKGEKTRLEDGFTANDDERQSKGADVSKVSLLD